MPLRPRRARTCANVHLRRGHDGGGGSSSKQRSAPIQAPTGFSESGTCARRRLDAAAFFRASARVRPAPSPGCQGNSLAFASSEPPKITRRQECRSQFSAGSTRASQDPGIPTQLHPLERVMFLNQNRLRTCCTLGLGCSHLFMGDSGAKVDTDENTHAAGRQ